MRITTNAVNDRILSELQRLAQDQNKYTRQLATGQRVNTLSDDPISSGRLLDYNSQKRIVQQLDNNAQYALQTAEATAQSLEQLKDLANKAFNLAANSGGKPFEDRSGIASQIDSILEFGFSLVNGKFDGNNLFGGSEFSNPAFSATRDAQGKITGVTYAGDPGLSPEVEIAEQVRVRTRNSGAANLQLEEMLNNLAGVRDAILAGDEALTNSLQNALGDNEDQILIQQGDAGAVQFRIEIAREQNASRFNGIVDLQNREGGVDLNTVAFRLKETQTSYEAALQVAAQLNKNNLLDYL